MRSSSGRLKWVILALLTAGWFIGNIDRYVINYAILDIAKDFKLNASQTGVVLSSFFLGMTFMQIPGGWLTDRFGYRKVLLTIVFVWSLFTGLTGAAFSLTSMIIVRFFFGVGEGSFYPASQKTIAAIFPKQERARAVSIVLSSGAVAGLLTPIFATSMMVTIGWRSLFYMIASVGVIIVLLFWVFLKPKSDSNSDETKMPSRVPYLKILKTPLIWSLLLAYFGVYTVSWGQNTWLPTYLVKVRHLNLMQLGYVSMIPGVVSFLSFWASGHVIDKLKPGTDKVLAVISSAASAVFLYLMFTVSTVSAFIIYWSIMQIFVAFLIVMMPSVMLKNLPSEIVGSASGLINFGGQLAGFATPLIMGVVIDLFNGSFVAAFAYMIVFACISLVAFLTLGHNKGTVFTIESKAT